MHVWEPVFTIAYNEFSGGNSKLSFSPFLIVSPVLVVTLLPPICKSLPTASSQIVRVAVGVEATKRVAVLVTVIAVLIIWGTLGLWVVQHKYCAHGHCSW